MARLLRATFIDGHSESVITWSPADTEELEVLLKYNKDIIVLEVVRDNLTKEESKILDCPSVRVVYPLPKEYRETPKGVRIEKGEQDEKNINN